MSKREKLIAHLCSEPPEALFEDVKKLLLAFHFEEVRSSGSHHVFRHKDGRMIVVPKKSGSKVKRIYIRRVTDLLGLNNHE